MAGCAGLPAVPPVDLPERVLLSEVPFYPQTADHCGPASVAMVLTWTGQPAQPQDVAEQVFTPDRKGSFQADVIAALRRHGRLAVPVSRLDDLLGELAAGHPVLVFQNLALSWFPQWHYAVAVGYDLPEQQILLHSGADAQRAVRLRTFDRTWARADRWALVVLPPEILPATADVLMVLDAALGIERAQRYPEAAAAYGAICAKWPSSLPAWIGLGNVRYALHDLPGAEAAFREAVGHHPDSAPAWNNLAHVLGEQAKFDAALAAARTAVNLGGPQADTYAQTLREITAAMAAGSP